MPPWELNNCSTGQKIPFLLWNLHIHFYVHKNHHRTSFWASKIHSTIQDHISLSFIIILCYYISYCDFECISYLPYVGYMSLPLSSFLILMVDFIQMWWILIIYLSHLDCIKDKMNVCIKKNKCLTHTYTVQILPSFHTFLSSLLYVIILLASVCTYEWT